MTEAEINKNRQAVKSEIFALPSRYVSSKKNKLDVAMEKSGFTELEYRELLQEERHMFAWTLSVYGGCDADAALQLAIEFYQYEEPNDLRGLVFHDEAWYWAMKKLYGDYYWIDHPEFGDLPLDYTNEGLRQAEQQTEIDRPKRQDESGGP